MERYDEGDDLWEKVKVVQGRTIYTLGAGEHIKLDVIWKQKWDEKNIVINEAGRYRAYGAIVDKDLNVLEDLDSEKLEASWEFDVS